MVALEGRQVVVVGGAIGGMTAALLLARAGATVTVLERVAEPAAASTTCWPCAAATCTSCCWRRPGRPTRRSRCGSAPRSAESTPTAGRRVVDADGAVRRRPMGDGSTYFYASATRPPAADALAAADLAGLRAAWAATLPLAGRVLERVRRVEELLVNQVMRVDCARWSDGRLVLVGDAAHAMSPNLGQGANSALVDAAVLALELAGDGPPEAALDRYTARRRPRVRRVQDTADRLARLADLTSPALRQARDSLLRAASGLGSDRRMRAIQQEDPARLRSAVAGLGRPG